MSGSLWAFSVNAPAMIVVVRTDGFSAKVRRARDVHRGGGEHRAGVRGPHVLLLPHGGVRHVRRCFVAIPF